MERRWLLVVGLALLGCSWLACGCSKKQPPDAAQIKHSGPHFVERPAAQPTTVVPETPGTSVAVSPAPQVPETYSPVPEEPEIPRSIGPVGSGPPRTAYVPIDPQPGTIQTPQPTFQPAAEPPLGVGNPLRTAEVPPRPAPAIVPDLPLPTFTPPTGNPLRFGPPAQFTSPLRPTTEPNPAGGSAPPDVAIPQLPVGSSPTDVPFAPGSTAGGPSEAELKAAAEAELLAQRRALQALAAEEAAKQGAVNGAKGPQAALAIPPQPFEIVKVFYGTDRQSIEPAAFTSPAQIIRFLPAGCAVLVTLGLGLMALVSRRRAMWALTACGVVAVCGLSWQALAGTLYEIRRMGHEGLRYTTARNARAAVEVGICDITIPKTHKRGELETPSILKLEIREDVSKHVTVAKIERLADEAFYQQLQARVAASPQRELFVFVHGFNVSFEDAARRTAQIHKDLKFPGAPVFFSWPANDKFVLTYKNDEDNVEWAVPHLKTFLLDVTRHSGAKAVHLIAHSMGNRALTGALSELQAEFRDETRLFNQVILAAPDIDAKRFRDVIAPAMSRTAQRITLYASSRDEALMASQLLHRSPRAGDAGRGLVVVPGIETIDVTAIDTSPWGHTYYGSSDPVLRDLGKVLGGAIAPLDRSWLAQDHHEGLPYWVFTPIANTARTPSGDSR